MLPKWSKVAQTLHNKWDLDFRSPSLRTESDGYNTTDMYARGCRWEGDAVHVMGGRAFHGLEPTNRPWSGVAAVCCAQRLTMNSMAHAAAAQVMYKDDPSGPNGPTLDSNVRPDCKLSMHLKQGI